MFRLNISVIVVLCFVVLSGCSTVKEVVQEKPDTEDELFQKAQAALVANTPQTAITYLNELERRFPFGEYSKSAQLTLIYSYYVAYETESANATADRFIRLHPKHPNVDYAYYMKGLSNFPRPQSLLQEIARVDLSARDISQARVSFADFAEMVDRFPDSDYTPDALKRMEYLRNLLARHELHIANYYLEREAYLAAVNRGQYILQNFSTSSAVADALAVMVQGYNAMEMNDLSNNSLQTLKSNYPNYPALNEQGGFDFDYFDRRRNTWLGKVTFGVLDSTRPEGFDTGAVYTAP